MPRLMKISEILQTACCSVDYFDCEFDGSPESWVRLMMEKCSWEMIISMHAEGQKYPIYFGNVDDQFIDEFAPGPGIGNGHHRLVAAILLGWDEILIEDQVADYCHPSTGSLTGQCVDADDDPDLHSELLERLEETLRDLEGESDY